MKTTTTVHWSERTLCGPDSGIDPEDFFPITPDLVVIPADPETGQEAVTAEELGKSHCRWCPVRQECLDDALNKGDIFFGIRGGLTDRERRDLSRQRARRGAA